MIVSLLTLKHQYALINKEKINCLILLINKVEEMPLKIIYKMNNKT